MCILLDSYVSYNFGCYINDTYFKSTKGSLLTLKNPTDLVYCIQQPC